jgi:DNA-binding transcriptional LysR family regulator
VAAESDANPAITNKPLGAFNFIYAVAPNHPLANMPEPLSDATLQQHRAVAVADSIQRGNGLTFGLLGGQDVFTVPTMDAKLDAQLRGLGAGFLPECMARPYVETGRLVQKKVSRAERVVRVAYAWRSGNTAGQGRALQWWLAQLESATTRAALLHQR